ncbi:hypothetical protein NKH41_30360, partial [Mesorhizobium sp. M1169]|uniref:hypothetical protein n=1 Tax=Mesorhizobium sp. M1169 TaxID=2957066 RepID=UPI003338279B
LALPLCEPRLMWLSNREWGVKHLLHTYCIETTLSEYFGRKKNLASALWMAFGLALVRAEIDVVV